MSVLTIRRTQMKKILTLIIIISFILFYSCEPEEPTAPGIVFLHGFGFGTGKEIVARWAIELVRRGFVVLSIDLPAQGYTTGSTPSIMPNAEFEPYVVLGAVNYLKSLPFVNSSSIGLIGHSFLQ